MGCSVEILVDVSELVILIFNFILQSAGFYTGRPRVSECYFRSI